MARASGIGRATLYWSRKQARKDKQVAITIEEWHELDDTLGHRKLAVLLRMGKNRVRRIMHKYGIAARHTRKKYIYPGKASQIAPNLVRQLEEASLTEVVFSDIFEVRLADSTRVRGCFALWQRTRHILAPAFDYHMRAELVTNALDMLAFEVSQAIFHSDQGKQYGAEVTRLLLLQKGFELSMSRAGKDAFLQKLRRSVLYEQELQANVYFIHDFQLVPLAEFFPWMRPPIWFCHVDTAHTNPSAQQYIQQFLDPYAIACFNSQASVFKDLLPEKAQVVTLGIDPLRVKNRPLLRERGMEILARCGIDTTRPLITQVSRFGIWKNPWQVIDIYRQVKQQMPTVQLAMIGALEAKDDITAEVILTDLQRHYVHGDPDIYLLSDPTIIDHEVVNAFQRYSSVVLQRSIREGFGFTVTEAMWKKQPVIGTCVTGLQLQISHGYNGYVVDDTETAAAYTLKFLEDRDPWRELGENAYDTVRQRFLFPTMILGYLQALARAQTNARALVKPGMALIETTGAGVELAA